MSISIVVLKRGVVSMPRANVLAFIDLISAGKIPFPAPEDAAGWLSPLQ